MQLTILVPIIGNFGKDSFYNRQEIGLARALQRAGHTLKVINLDPELSHSVEMLDLDGISALRLRARAIGSHGIVGRSVLRQHLAGDVIAFSDLQLLLPTVHQVCKEMGADLFPYIGTVTNSGASRNLFGDLCLARNMRVFRARHCIAKTNALAAQLHAVGCPKVSVLPVGLEWTSFEPKRSANQDQARTELGLPPSETIVGFVGRLEANKEPFAALEAFARFKLKNGSGLLLILGEGSLKSELADSAERLGIGSSVRFVPKMDQASIWRFYRSIDVLLNTNSNEIFGMCLLEAGFFGRPVVAVHAPGPDMVIEHGQNGLLVAKDELPDALAKALLHRDELGAAASQRVDGHFSWDATLARSNLLDLIRSNAD